MKERAREKKERRHTERKEMGQRHFEKGKFRERVRETHGERRKEMG